MKPRFCSLLAVAAAMVSGAVRGADSYVITNAPGWNLIANQLDNAAGNGIKSVIPSAPANSVLLKWNPASRAFNPVETYFLTGGWVPGTNILTPGAGLCFSNAGTTTLNMTFTGNPHIPTLPLNLGGGLHLVARQTNDSGSFASILGFNPPDFSVVYRFNPGAGRDPTIFAPPHYTIYTFRGSTGWNPAPPTNRVGESWWVSTNGSLPAVTVRPASATACPGDDVSFVASASGTLPLSYQWRQNGVNITGAVSSGLTLTKVSPSSAGDYSVVVSNPFGSTTSLVSTLSVPLPTRATGPTNIAGCNGSTVVLATTPSGDGPLTYQWWHNGVPLTLPSTNQILVGPLNTGTAGQYCVVVSGACDSVTNCATVSILGPTSATPLTDATRCVGDSATFTTSASGAGPFTYLWRRNGNLLTTATANTLVIQPVLPADAGTYCVTVIGACGAVTNCATLTVLAPTTAIGPSDQALCVGSRAELATTPSGSGPFAFRWFKNGVILTGQTKSSLTFEAVTPSHAGSYCVEVTGACGSVTNCADLRVGDFEPPVFACPSDITVPCSGPGGTVVTYSAAIADDCDPNPVLKFEPPSGSLFKVGTSTVVCTGSDASGNSSTCTFTVTVVDSLPVLRCPKDRVVAATSPAGAKVSFDVFAEASCSGIASVVCVPPSGSQFPMGSSIVECVATDGSGRQVACSFEIKVVEAACCDVKEWALARDGVGPSPRSGHAMAPDVDGSGVLLFGGDDGTLRGDTWEWNGTDWLLHSTRVGPSPRRFAGMVFDSSRKVVVLFGGVTEGAAGQVALSDTWEWDGAAWHAVQISTKPPARFSHAMAYDPVRKRVVLHGGANGGTADLQDTWEFDGSVWSQVPAATPSPGPRAGHALGWDGARVVLFGGRSQGEVFNDTWAWVGDRWQRVATTGPSARQYHSMAFDDYCGKLVLYGGGTSPNSVGSDTWEWDGVSWLLKSDTTPTMRWQQAAAHDSARGQTVLFGGTAGTQGRLGDTWLRSADRTPPQLVSVYGACGSTNLCLTFSKPVSPATALNPGNYILMCGDVTNVILGILRSEDGQIICLTLAKPLSGCSLAVQNLEDFCGNTLGFVQTGFECSVDACPVGSSGTEFWLTFPGNYAPDPTNAPAPRLFVTGTPGTQVTVSIPGMSPPYLASGPIHASGQRSFVLPSVADLGGTSEVAQPLGIHVMAGKPVSVYGLNHVLFSSDAYLGLPKSAIGKAYLVLSYRNAFASVPELNGSEFAIVGTEDDTTVTIRPSVDVGSHPAGAPFEIRVDKGETWQLRNTNSFPADLSGSVVIADKPVALFAGHACANVPSGDYFFSNHLVEQLLPTDSWGKTFVTMPLAGRLKGDTCRIIALFDGTTVTTNGIGITGSLGQGQFFELRLQGPTAIVASAPVLVAQYANSSDYDLVDLADPFMVLVLPTTMTSSKFVVHTPSSGFTSNYVNLYTTAAGKGAVQVDGVTLSPGSYSAIPNSSWFGARVAVGTGPHVLQSTNDAPLGAVVYGWDLYDSYGYPAGFCIPAPDVKATEFGSPPRAVVVPLRADCRVQVPDLASEVGNRGAALLIQQTPPAGSLVPAGRRVIATKVSDRLGNAQTFLTTMTTPPGLTCPPDIIATSSSPLGAVVNYRVELCDSSYQLVCIPPSGSVFAPGTTPVTCVATSVGPDGHTNDVVTCGFTVQMNLLLLGVSHSKGTVGLSWEGNAALQSAIEVAGPWVTVTNAPNPYLVSPTERQRFFRLRQ